MNRQEIQAEEEAGARWAGCLEEVHARLAGRFVRSEQRQRTRAYLQGLLSPLERKNGWQLAEAAGEANPSGRPGNCSAEHSGMQMRSAMTGTDLVEEKLADPAAVIVIDETGFVKKGTKSVGVAPQYSGTADKIGNCQIGVFLAYAAAKGQVLMDRELSLPREWMTDTKRCEEAGVPEKVELARPRSCWRAACSCRVLEHHLPCTWVTADCVSGDEYHVRRFLTEHQIPYVLAVHPQNQIRMGLYEGFASVRMDEWFARKHRGRWYRLSAGWGSKGPRWFDWAWRTRDGDVPDGWQAWVVVRRSISDPTEVVSHRVCAPKQTTLQQMVEVAGQRRIVEEAIERAKGECGLDQYEVRSWTGWYRHITLSLVAQLCATLMMDRANA